MPGGGVKKEHSTEKETVSLVSNMFGSATAGLIARYFVHPLDTIKARLQVQKLGNKLNNPNISIGDPHSHSKSKLLYKIRNINNINNILLGKGYNSYSQLSYKNGFDCFIKILKYEGIIGLYRGLLVASMGSCPAACLYFTSYEYTRIKLNNIKYLNNHSYIIDFLSGFNAELISCVLWVPIDVLKERMQVQSSVNSKYRYTGVINGIKSIIKQEGVSSLYKAYGGTLLSFGPFSGIYLMLYEQIKILYSNYYNIKIDNLPPYIIMISAMISGAFSSFITNPLDIVKVRMQVQRGKIFNFGYSNIFNGFYTIVKSEGIKTLFHGSGARVLFWTPNLAITLSIYDTCTKLYKNILYN